MQLSGCNIGMLFRCGDPKLVMSEEHNFTTAPGPGSQAYPQRLTVVADLGQTYNSSRTLEHIIASRPRVRPKTPAPKRHHCKPDGFQAARILLTSALALQLCLVRLFWAEAALLPLSRV